MTTTQAQPDFARSGGEITDILDLTLRLGDLLAHETEMLTAGRVRDIAALQIEKLRLTTMYDRATKALVNSGMKIESLAPPLRAQIVAASTRLTQMVTENERALRIGRAATSRLLDMVVESMRAQQTPSTRYTARLAPPSHMPVPAMALDRHL